MIWVILACILSGILYRMGGAKGYHTLWRDIGCSLVLLCLVGLLNGLNEPFWGYILTFGFSWLALSTYWDWLVGYDSHLLHGLGCGLAGIPLVFIGVPVWIVFLRLTICSLGMWLWSKYVTNDVKQEMGRGVFFII